MFKDFFMELDKSLDDLHVRSYGVGITTLEEVFLRIGHGEPETETDRAKEEEFAESLKRNSIKAKEEGR